jgi:hypothetical protein
MEAGAVEEEADARVGIVVRVGIGRAAAVITSAVMVPLQTAECKYGCLTRNLWYRFIHTWLLMPELL